jgi:hypothetical protein
MTLQISDKQLQAWQREHIYTDKYGTYSVTISNGRVSGFFNSQSGEHFSRFDFEYNPVEKRPHPWHKYGYEGSAHGYIGLLGVDCDLDEVPKFQHPNDLYQWIREYLGHPKTTFN